MGRDRPGSGRQRARKRGEEGPKAAKMNGSGARHRTKIDTLDSGKCRDKNERHRKVCAMKWETPSFVEINMSAEIGGYQSDFGDRDPTEPVLDVQVQVAVASDADSSTLAK
jgi:hypothetical protein